MLVFDIGWNQILPGLWSLMPISSGCLYQGPARPTPRARQGVVLLDPPLGSGWVLRRVNPITWPGPTLLMGPPPTMGRRRQGSWAAKTSHQTQYTCPFQLLVSSREYSDFIILLEGTTEKPGTPHLYLNLLFGISLLHGDLCDSLEQFANKCEAVCIRNSTCKVPHPQCKGSPHEVRERSFPSCLRVSSYLCHQ